MYMHIYIINLRLLKANYFRIIFKCNKHIRVVLVVVVVVVVATVVVTCDDSTTPLN